MKLKKVNSKGFTHLEIVFVILVIFIISAVGYFVWNNQSKSGTNVTHASSTTPAVITYGGADPTVKVSETIATVFQPNEVVQVAGPDSNYYFNPVYSPDYSKIVYGETSTAGTGNPLVIYTVATKAVKYVNLPSARVLFGSFQGLSPVWSVDGKKIAFLATDTNGTNNNVYIYVVNADGTGLEQIGVDQNVTGLQFTLGGGGVFYLNEATGTLKSINIPDVTNTSSVGKVLWTLNSPPAPGTLTSGIFCNSLVRDYHNNFFWVCSYSVHSGPGKGTTTWYNDIYRFSMTGFSNGVFTGTASRRYSSAYNGTTYPYYSFTDEAVQHNGGILALQAFKTTAECSDQETIVTLNPSTMTLKTIQSDPVISNNCKGGGGQPGGTISWSPDNSKIGYVRYQNTDSSMDLSVVNSSGTTPPMLYTKDADSVNW